MKYCVHLSRVGRVELEASSPEEAEELALECPEFVYWDDIEADLVYEVPEHGR